MKIFLIHANVYILFTNLIKDILGEFVAFGLHPNGGKLDQMRIQYFKKKKVNKGKI